MKMMEKIDKRIKNIGAPEWLGDFIYTLSVSTKRNQEEIADAILKPYVSGELTRDDIIAIREYVVDGKKSVSDYSRMLSIAFNDLLKRDTHSFNALLENRTSGKRKLTHHDMELVQLSISGRDA